MNLIAFSRSRNCVNTQYAALSGAMSHAKVCVNGRPICKRLLQKPEIVPFTLVNVAALMKGEISW